MNPLVARFLRLSASALVLCGGLATAQDLRDPPDQTFTVWPNIPVIRASDLGDYGQDRKIFADLHTAKADPAKALEALQAVDQLQAHHERSEERRVGKECRL